MMKIFKTTFAFIAIVLILNSCVYSLFPIYTSDTLVYIPELNGKWSNGEEEGDYIEFESKFETEDVMTFAIGIEGTVSAEQFGSKDYNLEDLVKQYQIGDSIYLANDSSEQMLEFQDVMTLSKSSMNYKLTTYEQGEKKEEYEAHLVQLGDLLLLDLYPYETMDINYISKNQFPVHSFFKIEIENDQVQITSFDLDNLNQLFTSNLIRLKHQEVDGTVLITAETKDLQKFLKRYADDDKVFEEPESYQRIDQ